MCYFVLPKSSGSDLFFNSKVNNYHNTLIMKDHLETGMALNERVKNTGIDLHMNSFSVVIPLADHMYR